MTDQVRLQVESHWLELRDERGKLYARIEQRQLLLEIKRSDRDMIAVFDLRDYLDILRDLDHRHDME